MPPSAADRLSLPPGSSRRPVPRWIGPLGALVVLGAVAAAFGGAYWEGYQLRREVAGLERERDRLRRHNAQLREEIRLLYEPVYIERVAREQLGLVRPDEIAIMLVRPTPAPAAPPADRGGPPATDGGDAPWWARLIRWLLD